jgi:hypothetical protein
MLIQKMESLKINAEVKSESGLDTQSILKIYENIHLCGQDLELLNIFVRYF